MKKNLLLVISIIVFVSLGLIILPSTGRSNSFNSCDSCNANATTIAGRPIVIFSDTSWHNFNQKIDTRTDEYDRYQYDIINKSCATDVPQEISSLLINMGNNFYIYPETGLEDVLHYISQTQPWKCYDCAFIKAMMLLEFHKLN